MVLSELQPPRVLGSVLGIKGGVSRIVSQSGRGASRYMCLVRCMVAHVSSSSPGGLELYVTCAFLYSCVAAAVAVAVPAGLYRQQFF